MGILVRHHGAVPSEAPLAAPFLSPGFLRIPLGPPAVVSHRSRRADSALREAQWGLGSSSQLSSSRWQPRRLSHGARAGEGGKRAWEGLEAAQAGKKKEGGSFRVQTP